MNFKKILLPLITVFMMSCDEDTIEIFDHEAQYVIEKPIIDEYLRTHYFDSDDNSIKEIDGNQTALIDDSNLQTLTATNNEVDYEMYSYVYEQGTQESPDADDTVNINYKTYDLTQENIYNQNTSNDNFVSLFFDIIGWQIGLQVFKGGISNENEPNLPRSYSEGGKGFLIIPSGLAYQNLGSVSRSIGENETLFFEIELKTVVPVESVEIEL